MSTASSSRFRIEGIQPILCVSNIPASRRFYVDLLGFHEDSWGDDHFTCIGRDGGSIYLCQSGQGNSSGTWLWIGVDADLYELHNQFLSKGIKIKMAPTNFSWALEMQIEDPDGHVLRF